MINRGIEKLRLARRRLILKKIQYKLNTRLKKRKRITSDNFDYTNFRSDLLLFLEENRLPKENHIFHYSSSCTKPTLYASAYSLMTQSLLNEVGSMTDVQKEGWKQYFDSFQRAKDGLFYDSNVQNDIYNETDWWGARHLAVHMISAYASLGDRPKYPFVFLKRYYNKHYIFDWLDQFDWQSDAIGVGDLDNKIMNIGCLLQYQRDYWDDKEAGVAIEHLKNYLRKKINSETGMWGKFNPNDPHQRSRMVQFAYHLFQIYFYDGDYDFDAERIIKICLGTQNKYGGFGVKYNSSACEDIDSIDTLIRFSQFVSPETKLLITKAIEKSFSWVILNQVNDGGFVFRLEEPFVYGHAETSSNKNEGDMLATWFRTLSLAYILEFLKPDASFKVNHCPGYEFK